MSLVLFIDEAYMLVGAGGLRPVRGDARQPRRKPWRWRVVSCGTTAKRTCLGANYEEIFRERPRRSPRRFQLVKLSDEPSPQDAVVILRGLRGAYEKSHGIYVRDDAVVAAAALSARIDLRPATAGQGGGRAGYRVCPRSSFR